MAEETTNPGYIDAQAYATDPVGNDTPDQQHNEYERGVKSYSLSQDGDSAALNSLLAPNTITEEIVVSADLLPDVSNTRDIGNAGVLLRSIYLGTSLFLGGTTSANELDDYEEGVWNPALSVGVAPTGLTYSVQTGNYTKVGRLVHVRFGIEILSIGTGGSGNVDISGLPFTAAFSDKNHSVTVPVVYNPVTAARAYDLRFIAQGTMLSSRIMTGADAQLQYSDLQNGTVIFASSTFEV